MQAVANVDSSMSFWKSILGFDYRIFVSVFLFSSVGTSRTEQNIIGNHFDDQQFYLYLLLFHGFIFQAKMPHIHNSIFLNESTSAFFWVLGCWSDKTSILNMSSRALGNDHGHFYLFFEILWQNDEHINQQWINQIISRSPRIFLT